MKGCFSAYLLRTRLLANSGPPTWQYVPALTGLLLPVLAVPAAAYGEHGWLGATVLVPYLFTLGGPDLERDLVQRARCAGMPACSQGHARKGMLAWLDACLRFLHFCKCKSCCCSAMCKLIASCVCQVTAIAVPGC